MTINNSLLNTSLQQKVKETKEIIVPCSELKLYLLALYSINLNLTI